MLRYVAGWLVLLFVFIMAGHFHMILPWLGVLVVILVIGALGAGSSLFR